MSREPLTNSPLPEQIASQNFGNCSGGMVRSASRIITTSPRAASKPANTASPLPVPGTSLDEDDFECLGEARDALDRRLDIAALVARGNDDRHRTHLGGSPQRAANGEMAQAQAADERQRRQETVDQPAEPEQPRRREHARFVLDGVEIAERR